MWSLFHFSSVTHWISLLSGLWLPLQHFPKQLNIKKKNKKIKEIAFWFEWTGGSHPCSQPAALLSWVHPVGSPGQRPGRTGSERPGCPWWPRCRPSARSKPPGCTYPSAPRTSAAPRRCPSRRGRSCTPGPDTHLRRYEQKWVWRGENNKWGHR